MSDKEKEKQFEKHFEKYINYSPFAIEILSPEGNIIKVNKAWMQLWDLNEEETQKVLTNYNMLSDKQIRDKGILPLVRKAFNGSKATGTITEINRFGVTSTGSFEVTAYLSTKSGGSRLK